MTEFNEKQLYSMFSEPELRGALTTGLIWSTGNLCPFKCLFSGLQIFSLLATRQDSGCYLWTLLPFTIYEVRMNKIKKYM